MLAAIWRQGSCSEDRVVPALLGLPGQFEHDVLDLGVFLERVRRHVLARPGLLEAAVRHLGRHHEVVVDLDVAEVQGPRRLHGREHVARPDARGESVARVVGHRQCLVNGIERQDREHRPEHLILDDLAVLGAVGDDRRAIEGAVREARDIGPIAAGHDPGARQRV
jgi:hypothetical protein